MTRCVFTAVIGDYEPLNPQPARAQSGIDWVCFTDDPHLRSEEWEVRCIQQCLPMDPIRSARAIKIRAREVWGDYDESLWIDNAVVLRRTPEELLDAWLTTCEFALPVHSFRGPVSDEFQEVLNLAMDDTTRVVEQWNTYALTDPDSLTEQTLWTALLARRHTPSVGSLMDVWFGQVLRHSRRDQLSLPWALRRTGCPAELVTLDNHESTLHSWPQNERRLRDQGPRLSGSLARPLGEQAAVQERRSDILTRQLEAVTEEASNLLELCEQRRRCDGQALAEATAAKQECAAQVAQSQAALIEVSTELAAMVADRDNERGLRALAEAQAESAEEKLSAALGSRRWQVAEAIRHPVTVAESMLARRRGSP